MKMNMDAFVPTGLLQPFIKKYIIIESGAGLVNRVLPDTSLVLAFRYKGGVNFLNRNAGSILPAIVFSGLRKSVRLIHYTKDTGNILVLFKVAGATAFFREPLHEIFEESIALQNFVSPHHLVNIEEQLAGAGNNGQRIAIVERFLLSRLKNTERDRLITTAVQKIQSAKGILKIKNLADTLYISHDALEKRFRKSVGTSPKQFSTIIRLKAVISDEPKEQTFTRIAFEAGYFDQPHFNKEFKLFTGQTPTDFFKNPLFW